MSDDLTDELAARWCAEIRMCQVCEILNNRLPDGYRKVCGTGLWCDFHEGAHIASRNATRRQTLAFYTACELPVPKWMFGRD